MTDAATTVQPPAPPPPPPPAAPPAPPAADPGAPPVPAPIDPAVPPAADPGTTPPAPATDPVQDRFAVLTRQKWDEKRRADAAEAELARLRAAPPPAADPNAPPAQPAPHDPHAVTREAARIVAEREWNQKCNKLADTTRSKYADFSTVLTNFDVIGGLGQQPALVSALIADELDNAPDVLYHLGKNISEADRLSQLPPVQMAIAIAQLSHKLKASPGVTVSQAPAPITPIAPTPPAAPAAEPDAGGDFKSQADYKAWRAKNKKR